MAELKDTAKHKDTITKALVLGINTARKTMDDLRLDLMNATFGTPQYVDLERQIDLMDEWAKELGWALLWLNGDELSKMNDLLKCEVRKAGV